MGAGNVPPPKAYPLRQNLRQEERNVKSKYLALVLVVVLVLVGLVACGQAQNQDDQQEPQDLDVQQTAPVDTEKPVDTAEPVESDTPDEPEETQAPEVDTPANLSQQSQPEDNTISGDELIAIFQYAYDFGKDPMISEENRLDSELIFIETFARSNMPSKQLPEDYIERYIEWRPFDGEESLFNDCNETVYATIDMNIRESWSTSSTKVGSLPVGQSITRIGTGIPGTEAEGWSMVQLSDGTIAYMVSSYLSTTKPSTGGGNPGGSGGGSPAGGGSGGGSDWVDPSTQHIDPSQNHNDPDHPGTQVDPSDYHNGTGPSGWGSAGGEGLGANMG